MTQHKLTVGTSGSATGCELRPVPWDSAAIGMMYLRGVKPN